MRRAACLAAAVLVLAGVAGAEVVWLRNGDRISGTIVSETARSVRLQTPHGRLTIAKSAIERLVRKGGKEEPAPAAPARLVLVVTGASFWQAWDRKDAPADPTLRLEASLDEEPFAVWTDAQLDPRDLPGAVVNTFAFDAGAAAASAVGAAQVEPPEVQPGRVRLRVELPGVSGEHTLRVAYQVHAGAAESPAWRTLAEGSATVSLGAGAPAVVEVRQDRGRMEYAGFPRRRMRQVETFRVTLAMLDTPGGEP